MSVCVCLALLRRRTESFLRAGHASFEDGSVQFQQEPYLSQHLVSLRICDLELSSPDGLSVPAWKADLNVRAFQLHDEGAAEETEGDVTSCNIWMLPATVRLLPGLSPLCPTGEKSSACHRLHLTLTRAPRQEFHGLWDTLVYDVEVKNHLLDYAQSAMYFADKRVDPNVIAWNRVVLLHGASWQILLQPLFCRIYLLVLCFPPVPGLPFTRSGAPASC